VVAGAATTAEAGVRYTTHRCAKPSAVAEADTAAITAGMSWIQSLLRR